MKVGIVAVMTMLLVFAAGCGAEEKPNLLLGTWKAFHVDRGGTIIAGPHFKGTEFTFRPNETVFAQSPQGDTLTSRYRHNGDTLTYIGISTFAEEVYQIDSLTVDRLKISANIDGIPTVITMKKLKN